MDLSSLIEIVPALVAALAAYAAGRSSSKVTRANAQDNNRVEMEKEAYDRARRFDTETITRQDAEMAELRAEMATVKAEATTVLLENRQVMVKNQKLERRVQTLTNRVNRLEEALPHDHPLKQRKPQHE